MSHPIVIMGGAFGVMQADEAGDTAGWVGDERLVIVEYEVGEYADLGEADPFVVHVETVEVMR
jgi:hypothetical protein